MNRGASLARRLLVRSALAIVLVLAALAVLLDRTLENAFLDDLTSSLAAQGRAVRAVLEPESPDLQARARELGAELGVRVTIVRTDGVVLADSARDPATMENHAGRPEIRAAVAGQLGVTSRTSETTGEPYRYVAIPSREDVVVRVALALSVVRERLLRVRGLVAGATALAAALALAAVWLVGRSVTRPLRRVTEAVERLPAGNERVPEEGASELAVLGGTINRMREELELRIEEARRDRRQREAILAAMQEGVVLVDERGDIAYANPASQRILGRPATALRDLVPPPLRSAVERAAEGGAPQEQEVELGVPPRSVRASAVPLSPGRGVLLVVRDVTEARRVETMRRDFVADASHELKTPAAAIRAAAETVERAATEDPEAAARFATQVRREAERLSRIVSDLLDLSRLESERAPRDRVRLDRVVEEEVERLRGEAAASGVRLEVETTPVDVEGSRKDLALLARNLLENAVRYTPGGGRVRVSVEGDGEGPTLTVADDGTGIPSRDLPRIFERFYRVDRARSRDTGGTGLGLSIARHVAEQHGGTIEAESELGAGSTFRVRLPAGTG